MVRKDSGRGKDLWQDDYFIDINSNSSAPAGPSRERPQGAQTPGKRRPAPAAPRGQARPRTDRKPRPAPKPPRSIREADGFEEYERPRRPSGGPESRRNPTPPRRPRPKSRSPMGGKARRMMLAVTLLTMAVVTALLCVFLLFKVSEIEITGDKVYEDPAILDICGYKAGDNLVFLSTADREKALKEQLPYIAEVDIRRHFPSTLEIHITGAQVASCVSSGGSWLYTSGTGKILERKDAPKEGVMQVVGLAPLDTEPGKDIRVENEDVQSAYREIVSKLTELGAVQKFTKLDLSDLYDIRLWYEDRVELKLGNAAELSYKLEFGCSIVTDTNNIGPKERGTLDLSYADVKRADFSVEAATPSPSPSAPPGGDSSGGDTSSGGRGGIPDSLFTGDQGTSGDSGDTGGDGTDTWDDGNGGTDAWDDGGDTWDDGGDAGTWDTGGGDDTGGGGDSADAGGEGLSWDGDGGGETG